MENVQQDKLLFQRIAEGDEFAFRQLFDTYTPRLKAYFSKLVRDPSQVKELVQETFLNLWVYRQGLSSVENPSAYLYRIASNVSVKWFRQAELDKQIIKAVAAQRIDHHNDPELLSLKELQKHITKAVDNLPPQQQEVFKLSREGGLSRSGIANRMNLSEKTVRNYMTLALESIQKHLAEHYRMYIPLFLIQELLG